MVAAVLAWAPGVKAEPDLSSPKSAALSFAVALEKGDTEAAKAAAVLTPQNSEMISVLSEMGQNVNKLREAAKASNEAATIEAATKKLADDTEAFAAQRMNAGIARALSGRKVESL
jgi:hypothetical protein